MDLDDRSDSSLVEFRPGSSGLNYARGDLTARRPRAFASATLTRPHASQPDSSALRQTAGSRPLSLTTHVAATSPAPFYLLDPEHDVIQRDTSSGGFIASSFGGRHHFKG
jgi:hypothetical protein